jgi:DNA polymerase V
MVGIPSDLTAYGIEIAHTVKQWTGIPVSIGIAPTKTLAKVAVRGLRRIFKGGYKYQKAGVMLLDLVPQPMEQLTLFKESQIIPENKDRLMTVVDDINLTFGRDSIRLGGTTLSNSWRMRQAMLSPAYTTRWEELPIARLS